MALISVIVPVYKVEQYLERCVNSVLAQTFSDFELILIDDGSPDKCGEICEMYAQKDPRIVVIHQENGGLSAARNTGIDWAYQNSNSHWITFIDSDDWIHPQYLEVLYNAAAGSTANISVCGFHKTHKQEVYTKSENPTVQTFSPEEFWIQDRVNATVAWGKLYKKKCFSEIRYPIGKLHEDEYVTYKVLFDNNSIAVTDEKLYYYFQNDDGIMKATWNVRRLDGVWAFKEQLDYFVKNNYKKAAYRAAECYVDYLVYALIQLQTLESCGNQIDLLRSELRKIVRTYGKKLEILKKKKTLVYRVAYPKQYEVCDKIRKKTKNVMILYKEKGFYGLWEKIQKK